MNLFWKTNDDLIIKIIRKEVLKFEEKDIQELEFLDDIDFDCLLEQFWAMSQRLVQEEII